jgi:protein-tyrosine phosphatase
MGTGINEVWLPVEAEGADVINIRHEVEAGRVDAQAASEFLIEANRLFVTRFAQVYSKFLHLLLQPQSLPLVFHCSAGKDRAGYAAALTLLVAGASKHDVMTDYLATNRCNENHRRALTAALPKGEGAETTRLALDVLMQVEERYLAAAFSEINASYLDVSDYMSRALVFDADKQASLKALLTVSIT